MSNSVRRRGKLHWVRGWVRWLAPVILVLPAWWSPSVAWADPQLPLLVEIEASSFVSRSCGPIPLTLKVQWAGSGILEGKLVLELSDQGRERLGTLVVDDFFVAPGEQRMGLLIPSLPTTWNEQVDVRAMLFTENRQWDLGSLVLRVPGSSKRTMVVRVVVPESTLDAPHSRARADSNWLSLENVQPKTSTSLRGTRRSVTTLHTEAAAEALSQDPHWHCTQDIMLVTMDGFRKLEPAQLTALLAWVRAGGSVCVFLGSGRLSPGQSDALNQLAGVQEDVEPVILTDRAGEILWPAMRDQFDTPRQFHFGLGRAVLARVDEDHLPTAKDAKWQEAAAFLWKFRNDQVAAVQATGYWSLEVGERAALTGLDYYQRSSMGSNDLQAAQARMAADFTPRPIGGGTGLVEKLLPRGLQLVPLWLITLVLLLYILTVGPIDYLLLGALRMRKYTWVLFPVTTLAFLVFAILLSNRYLKRGDHRGVALFLDVVDGGLIARENELQLLFSGAARRSMTEVSRCLFSPLRYQDFGTGNSWQLRQIRRDQAPVPMILEGRMPTQVRAVQALTQWSPQLNRITRIPRTPKLDDTGFDWDAPIAPLTDAGRSQLSRRIAAAFGRDVIAHAYVSRGGSDDPSVATAERRIYTDGSITYSHNAVSYSPNSGFTRIVLNGEERVFGSNYDQQYIAVAAPGGGYRNQLVMADFVQQASVREQPGLFSLVSQVSPMGGHRFEDMALLDPSREGDVLLVIAKRDGEKWTIYRRLYRSGDGK